MIQGSTLDRFPTGRLLPLVFFFDHGREFQTMTANMVYNTDTNKESNYGIDDKLVTLLPDGLIGRFSMYDITTIHYYSKRVPDTLHFKEHQIKDGLLKGLDSIITKPLNLPCAGPSYYPTLDDECSPYSFTNCHCSLIVRFISTLHQAELWPLATMGDKISLRQLIERLEDTFSPDMEKKAACSCTKSMKDLVAQQIDKAKKAFEGLCLDCVKEGDSRRERKCRTTHDGYRGIINGL